MIKLLPGPQIAYLFTDLYKETIIRNLKKVGFLGLRLFYRDAGPACQPCFQNSLQESRALHKACRITRLWAQGLDALGFTHIVRYWPVPTQTATPSTRNPKPSIGPVLSPTNNPDSPRLIHEPVRPSTQVCRGKKASRYTSRMQGAMEHL